jgi:hypothetical protein
MSSRICAKVTTSRNMATLYALIAILLLYLQTLYNIIVLTFVIAISLFPEALIPEVGEGVENVDRREGVGRGGGSITTLK